MMPKGVTKVATMEASKQTASWFGSANNFSPAPCQREVSTVFLTASRLRRVRLVVRTQPSQGWYTGSTPVRAARGILRFLELHHRFITERITQQRQVETVEEFKLRIAAIIRAKPEQIPAPPLRPHAEKRPIKAKRRTRR